MAVAGMEMPPMMFQNAAPNGEMYMPNMVQQVSKDQFNLVLGRSIRTLSERLNITCVDVWTPRVVKKTDGEKKDRLECQNEEWFIAKGTASHKLQTFHKLMELFSFPPSVDVFGRVWKTGQPELFPSIEKVDESKLYCLDLMKEAGFESVAVFPLFARNREVVMVLGLYFNTPMSFDASWTGFVDQVLMSLSPYATPTFRTIREEPEPKLPSPHISFSALSKYFHLPINLASKELKTCTTIVKKMCRQQGIHRWPYRKVESLNKSISALELMYDHALDGHKTLLKHKIMNLRQRRVYVMKDPRFLREQKKGSGLSKGDDDSDDEKIVAQMRKVTSVPPKKSDKSSDKGSEEKPKRKRKAENDDDEDDTPVKKQMTADSSPAHMSMHASVHQQGLQAKMGPGTHMGSMGETGSGASRGDQMSLAQQMAMINRMNGMMPMTANMGNMNSMGQMPGMGQMSMGSMGNNPSMGSMGGNPGMNMMPMSMQPSVEQGDGSQQFRGTQSFSGQGQGGNTGSQNGSRSMMFFMHPGPSGYSGMMRYAAGMNAANYAVAAFHNPALVQSMSRQGDVRSGGTGNRPPSKSNNDNQPSQGEQAMAKFNDMGADGVGKKVDPPSTKPETTKPGWFYRE